MKDNGQGKINRRDFLKMSGLAAIGVAAGPLRIEASLPSADMVLTNGKIVTVGPKDSIAQAMVVRNGRILEVGSTEMAARYIGPGTRLIDLKGRTVTPGLIDSHAHLPPFGLRESGAWVKVQGMETREEIFEAVAKRARTAPPGTFINAWGVESNALNFMDKRDLDRITSSHPVLVVHTTGQWGFANSTALALAGIDRNTPNPPGSRIQKGFNGEPTGLLIHYPALYLVRKCMPALKEEDARSAILHAARLYAREGVTAVHDNFLMIAEVGTGRSIKAYIDLVQTKTLPVRIKLWPYIPNLKEVALVMDGLFCGKEPKSGSNVFELSVLRRQQPALFNDIWGGLKIAIDGSGSTSVWYNNRRAVPLHTETDLRAMVRLFHGAGQQISVHAVGDEAVDLFLDAVEAARKNHRREDARHRIEHAICPQGRSLERIKDLGVVISTHPQFIYSWGDKWDGLKGERVIPLKSYKERGIVVAFGADPPAFPLWQPQIALWQAVVRKTRGGYHFAPDEAVTIGSALRMQTMGSAFAAFQEKDLGSIEKGKLADVVVWDKDLTTVPADGIRSARAELTIVGGKIVHNSAETEKK